MDEDEQRREEVSELYNPALASLSSLKGGKVNVSVPRRLIHMRSASNCDYYHWKGLNFTSYSCNVSGL